MKAKNLIFSVVAAGIVALSLMCSTSKSPSDNGGGGGGGTATASYYGFTPGTIFKAHYYNYVTADGRLLTIDSLRFDVTITVGAVVTYHGAQTIPIHISNVGAISGEDIIDAIVHVSIKADGLYWHGVQTCSNDFALPTALRLAPFPITGAANWLYADLIPAQLEECLAGLVSGRTLDIHVSGPTSHNVQGTAYSTVYTVQVVYQQDNYEVWFVPDVGIVLGCDYWETTFEHTGQGFQVYEKH